MNESIGNYPSRRVSDANHHCVRLSLLFAALFLITGVQLPYLPVWLDWRGLTPAEIGIVTSTPLFVGLVVTPTIAFVADRVAGHRKAIVVLAWCALAAVLGLGQM